MTQRQLEVPPKVEKGVVEKDQANGIMNPEILTMAIVNRAKIGHVRTVTIKRKPNSRKTTGRGLKIGDTEETSGWLSTTRSLLSILI